ncbi:hypothetical protein BGX26_009018 [Mortierella sp. AD094]|nr:hypothetical protein BGX26_009018 [Mortierella sp. AD094]
MGRSSRLKLSVVTAMLAFTNASPIERRGPQHKGLVVPLTRSPHFKHNVKAQIVKMNKRYPGINVLSGSSGKVPLIEVAPELEYYGTVSAGTPG